MPVPCRLLKLGSLATALVAFGCGGDHPAVDAAAPAPPPIVTLRGLEHGDRACYVIVESAGVRQSLEGDFELCAGGSKDATRLIDQRVTFTTRPERVLAGSCQGDVDCGESDEVDLVVAIAPASG